MDKLNKLQAEAPKEIPKFLKALKLMKEINGLSISGDDDTYQQIKKTLSFRPSTPEGRELKRNMLSAAKKKSQEGMFGNGMFMIN